MNRVSLTLFAVAAISCAASGCGSSKSAPTVNAAAKAEPAYRVGQYCVARTGAPYRRYELKCLHHHLAR